VIRSWRSAASRKFWQGERPNRFRGLDVGPAIDLLLALNVAEMLQDLSPLKSVGLHKLKGDRKGQWAMTVNGPWRICFEFRKGDAHNVEIVNYHRGSITTEDRVMPPIAHPGRLLRRELKARGISANRLALDLGVPSGRVTDILNGRRSITADTAVRLGRFFGNRPQFWLDLQGQYEIALVERERGEEIARRVQPADAA
jgi:addiction module HigA family antidote